MSDPETDAPEQTASAAEPAAATAAVAAESAAAEPSAPAAPASAPAPAPEPASTEPASAAEQLRAAEDKYLGADVPRVEGSIEVGHGSKFNGLPDEHKQHIFALRALVAVEDEIATLERQLKAAKDKIEGAAAAVIAAAKKVI